MRGNPRVFPLSLFTIATCHLHHQWTVIHSFTNLCFKNQTSNEVTFFDLLFSDRPWSRITLVARGGVCHASTRQGQYVHVPCMLSCAVYSMSLMVILNISSTLDKNILQWKCMLELLTFKFDHLVSLVFYDIQQPNIAPFQHNRERQ
jgi:hypothetical protein